MTGPDAGLEALKAEVAEAHGLGPDAVPLLSAATTADEVEAAVRELVRLVHTGGRDRQPEPEPSPSILDVARRQKAERKAELHRLFSGRPTGQPRDDRGRYAGFDGGARPTLPTPADPTKGHAEVVGTSSRSSH